MTSLASAKTPRGRERRQLLLSATVDLVSERGFHAVGIADIGAAAGVTGSAIYRHFKDKTELLVALFDHVVTSCSYGRATSLPRSPILRTRSTPW